MATNQPVAKYYGNEAISFRTKNIQAIAKRLNKPQTVAIDYYALYGVCAGLIPNEILQTHYSGLLAGNVYVFRVHIQGDKIYWEEK